MKSEPKIGQIIDGDARRDAIHVAIFPAVAARTLFPGQQVGLTPDGAQEADVNIGIVDPYLPGKVTKGDRFYVFLFPGTVTSLRHEWTHPAFDSQPEPCAIPDDKAASEAWLRDFCKKSDCPNYETVLAAASGQAIPELDYYGGPAYENDGEYLFFSGRDAHADIPAEFWHHIEVVTGVKIAQNMRATSFSCSC